MGTAIAMERLDNFASIATPKAQPPVDSHKPQTLNPSKKKILFVTSELADLIKVGGLGDVSAALPRALSGQHDIRVLIPGYPQVLESGHPMRVVGQIRGHAALPPCRIGRMELPDGLIVYVLISPELYERAGTPYGDENSRDWPDNHIRFARLGLAAADIAAANAGMSWCPDLVHANDWPTALTPAYMKWQKQTTPSVFTIHNLAYQGMIDSHCSPELGLPPEASGQEGMEFYGQLSLLKAGITYADHITTVSHTYAEEITTEAFGCGMQGMLQAKTHEGHLSGITNGIDESWDPRTDPHLVAKFSLHNMDGKRANAAYVEQLFNLEADDGPLFAVVSRLVQQKGIDLTLEVVDTIVQGGGRLAIIGRGEPELEQAVVEMAKRYPGRVGVRIGFNETDARRMFAGSDFLLMPSRFEPCGLSQMYAQRFGSLPIARKTGGLADTIEDGVTGFLFRRATRDSYVDAVQRALNVFQYPELLHAMRCRAMASPLYWKQSVEPYDRLYKELLQQHAGRARGYY
ncbi:glycogen synthase GlgA [Pseudomonas sp. GV071]|uniref:glycogen synthase GlgA n=1 Tax=Pseudomonas sp. GV071 TaxID=2135754 RepID=UPI000D33952B|nr:glycogen synthase GlgA [Pseudomonas sp. GV071]PTQ68398.1 starch synthase [Pseudomonas sp. GV071]